MQAVEDAAGSSGDAGTGAGGLTVLPPIEQAATAAAATQTVATIENARVMRTAYVGGFWPGYGG
jgi:hypothetical protein